MPKADRAIAERMHAIIKAGAPALLPRPGTECRRMRRTARSSASSSPRTSSRRDTRRFGFSDAANLDDGAMWPTSFALTKLTAADEKKIAALVKKAVS